MQPQHVPHLLSHCPALRISRSHQVACCIAKAQQQAVLYVQPQQAYVCSAGFFRINRSRQLRVAKLPAAGAGVRREMLSARDTISCGTGSLLAKGSFLLLIIMTAVAGCLLPTGPGTLQLKQRRCLSLLMPMPLSLSICVEFDGSCRCLPSSSSLQACARY